MRTYVGSAICKTVNEGSLKHIFLLYPLVFCDANFSGELYIGVFWYIWRNDLAQYANHMPSLLYRIRNG